MLAIPCVVTQRQFLGPWEAAAIGAVAPLRGAAQSWSHVSACRHLDVDEDLDQELGLGQTLEAIAHASIGYHMLTYRSQC